MNKVTHTRHYPRSFPLVWSILVLAALYGCTEAGETTRADSIEAIERQHTEIWSKGNLGVIAEIYTEDFVGHFPGGRLVNGHDGIQSTVESHRQAFPDWHEDVIRILVDGHFAVSQFRSSGTHQGEFLGHPASGNRIEITETCIYRMVDGRIAEQWVYPDIASMQTQLSSE